MLLPENIATVYVHGKVLSAISGMGTAGSITFSIPLLLKDNNAKVVLTPDAVTVGIDATGAWAVTLPATDDPDIEPVGWTYVVNENWPGGRQSLNVALPAMIPDVDWTTVVPTSVSSPVYTPVAAAAAPSDSVVAATTHGLLPTPGVLTNLFSRGDHSHGSTAAQTTESGGGSMTSLDGRLVPLIIITGESNSGGYAVNADATPTELGNRPKTLILNNATMLFEPLNIGSNNLIGHTGLAENATHGLELGLANSLDAGEWASSKVYLVKTGQGASRVDEWDEGGAYVTTFYNRVRTAKALIREEGLIPVTYVWFSLGVNDAIAGMDVDLWKIEMRDWHSRIRAELGEVPIFMTRFMTPYENYDVHLDEMAAENGLTFTVSTTDATQRDANHWDYAGMKLIAERFVKASTHTFGELDDYLRMQAYLANNTVILPAEGILPSLTLSPAAIAFTEGTEGAVLQVSLTRAPSADIVVDVTTTGDITPSVTTLTFTPTNFATKQGIDLTSADDTTESGNRLGSVTISSSAVSGPVTVVVTVVDADAPEPEVFIPFTWQDFTNSSEGPLGLTSAGTAPSSGVATEAIDATAPFEIEVAWRTASRVNAAIAFLDNSPTPTFVWNSSLTFVSGIYTYGGTVFVPSSGAGEAPTGLVPTFPLKLRARKSGNDLIYASSPDDGVTFTDFYTHVGVLTGQTSLYVKGLFAVPGSGQAILVSHSAETTLTSTTAPLPVNTTLPVISGTTALGDTLTSSPGSWTNSPTYDYQWRNDETPIEGETANTYIITTEAQGHGISCQVTATNDAGIGTAISADKAVPDADVIAPEFVPVVWENFGDDAAQGDEGELVAGTGTHPGGCAEQTIDATVPFDILIEYATADGTNAIIVYLDDNDDPTYLWVPEEDFVFGVYQYAGGQNVSTGGASVTASPVSGLTFPMQVLMSSSGMDITVANSVDDGETFVLVYTHVNGLLNQTTLHVKSLFAVASAGQKIKVSIKQ